MGVVVVLAPAAGPSRAGGLRLPAGSAAAGARHQRALGPRPPARARGGLALSFFAAPPAGAWRPGGHGAAARGGAFFCRSASSPPSPSSSPDSEALRRFVVVMHHSLPACACSFRLVALDQSRLDLACRCISSALLLSDGVRRDTEVICLFPPADDLCAPPQRGQMTAAGEGAGDAAGEEAGGGWLGLRLHGAEVAHMRPDERNVASVVRRAAYPSACAGEDHHVPPVETTAHEVWCAANPAPVVVPPKGQGRRHVGRGAGEGRPWRNSDASNKCARGVSLSRVPSFEALFAEDSNRVVLLAEAETPGGVGEVSASLMGEGGGGDAGWTVVLGDQVGLTGEEQEKILEAARAGGRGRRGERVSLGPASMHAHQCVAIVQHHLDLSLLPPPAPAGGSGGAGAGAAAACPTRRGWSWAGAAAGPPRAVEWGRWGAAAAQRGCGGAAAGRRRAVPPGASEGGRWAPVDGVPMHPRRLDKFLLDAGVGTRDDCKAAIREGRALINGERVRQHRMVDPPRDVVTVDGAEARLRAPQLYALYHKPAGAITAMSDPYGRAHIGALVPPEWHDGSVSHVGRLDANTTGALLFTDDGDLGHLISQGRGGGVRDVWKRYVARVAGDLSADDPRVTSLEGEMDLGSGCVISGARVRVLPPTREGWTDIIVEVNEGRNQQVRRMVGAAHLQLISLHRSAVGPLELGDDVPEGSWRELTGEEVEALYEAAGGRCQVAEEAARALESRLGRGTLEGPDQELARMWIEEIGMHRGGGAGL